MTFTEFIKSLTIDQVNTWWDEKAPNTAPETDEKNNWKYRLRKNRKSLPFKWSIEALAAHYSIPFTSKNFNSDLSSRDAFCEAFDFEIEEELVYDNTEASNFVKLYEKFRNTRDVFQQFLNYSHSLILKYDIDAYKIRMAISKQDREAMVIIGMRCVLSYKEVDEIAHVGFIIDENLVSEIDKTLIAASFPFDGDNKNRALLRIKAAKFERIPKVILESNEVAFLDEYQYIKDKKRALWNQEAKTSNSALKYLIYKGLDVENWVLKEKVKQKNMKSSEQKGLESNSGENTTSKMPLNKILYGPPGTGKTFKLKSDYFPKYTTKETAITKEAYFENVVRECSWWQVIVVALLQMGKSKVSDIAKHPWVVEKERLSNSKTVRPTIWGQLQSHTVESCEFVNVKSKQQPFIFNKTEDSSWEVLEEEVKDQIPEIYNLINSVEDFNPNPDKEIKRYVFATFHQAFGYEDFIEGIKPIMSDDETVNDLAYRIEDGIFKQICSRAETDPENRYAIFIDEINRGNVSAIFGELITLIENDKRIGMTNGFKVKLPYSKKEFGVPANLDIIGTMNTADRSVESLDTALRRRFVFEEMMPKPETLQASGENKSGKIQGIDLRQLLEIMNQRIEVLVDRDHTIGHAFFIDNENIDDLRSTFANKIIPLLQEYFYGDYGKMMMVIGQDFFHPQLDASQVVFAVNHSEYRPEGKVLKLKNIADKEHFSDEQLIAALKKMINPKENNAQEFN